MSENMVVILTALNLEYGAVRRRMIDPQVHLHGRGTRFEVGNLSNTDCRVALALTGKGNQPAAVLAERAIREFEPIALLFVGVAGALWDNTLLGDVIVASHVYSYHGGTSEDDGLKARPRVWESDHGINQLASHVARSGEWVEELGPTVRTPNVHFGGIAAGEVVKNSTISSEAEWLRQHYNDAIAIEMESAGVAQAAHLNGSPVAIVRGISDKSDGTKSSRGDETWQSNAADNAAAFAVRLAKEIISEQERNIMYRGQKANAGDTVTNIAHGAVGIQAKEVTGSTVSVGSVLSSPATNDLTAALISLHEELALACSSGRLDQATYEAAKNELDLARSALDDGTDDGKGRFVLALKRLRGLIYEIADIVPKIAVLITAVASLS